MSLDTRKVLFFTASSIPTASESALIARIRGTVCVRNASRPIVYIDNDLEACDAVAGLVIPAAYIGEDDVTPLPVGVPEAFNIYPPEIVISPAVAATWTSMAAIDGTLEVHSAGVYGNDVSISFYGDSPSGVTFVRTGADFVFHFENGVSTPADIEAAITAMAGGDDIFGVKIPSTVQDPLSGYMTTTFFRGGLGPVTAPLYAVAAELDEDTALVSTSDLAADPRTSWESDDEAVVTVDTDGIIESVAVGTAAITATLVVAVAVKAQVLHAEYQATDFDTDLDATTAGVAGNSITVALAGDSVRGVEIVRDGTSFIVHFQPDVSTVTDVETAIAALSGGDDLFGVKTTGTGAHVLVLEDAFQAASLSGGADEVAVHAHCTVTVEEPS